jgi:hypothetical protein
MTYVSIIRENPRLNRVIRVPFKSAIRNRKCEIKNNPLTLFIKGRLLYDPSGL